MVNESLPSRNRVFYYSIVQSGWALGVMFAAMVYILTIHFGWRIMFLWGVASFALVVIGRIWIKEPAQFKRIKEIRDACESDDEDKAKELSETYDIPIDNARTHKFRELFGEETRKQTTLLALFWFFYATGDVADNLYIVYWLTHIRGWSNFGAVYLLLGCAAIGALLYVTAGWLGRTISHRRILLVNSFCAPVVALIFMFMQNIWLVAIFYFFLYQTTNAFVSGVGFAYNAESFPTRLRGTAMGFLDAALVSGYLFGAAIWTGLIHHINPDIIWGILTVGFASGQIIMYFCRDIEPGKSLQG